nr:thioredoxin family protein [uncultured Desulfobacter sp.]
MRKENILVGILVVLVLGGIYLYNRPEADMDTPAAKANLNTSETEKQTVQDSTSSTTTTTTTTSPDAILWNDYTPGMALAEKEGKSIFLYFHADWCGYCRKLKNETFKDDRIKAYLNDNFVSISVDTDKRQNLAQQWGVRGLPTLWFLEADGKKVNSLPGFVDADQLYSILQYIHTQSYKNMTYQEYVQQKKS